MSHKGLKNSSVHNGKDKETIKNSLLEKIEKNPSAYIIAYEEPVDGFVCQYPNANKILLR